MGLGIEGRVYCGDRTDWGDYGGQVFWSITAALLVAELRGVVE